MNNRRMRLAGCMCLLLASCTDTARLEETETAMQQYRQDAAENRRALEQATEELKSVLIERKRVDAELAKTRKELEQADNRLTEVTRSVEELRATAEERVSSAERDRKLAEDTNRIEAKKAALLVAVTRLELGDARAQAASLREQLQRRPLPVPVGSPETVFSGKIVFDGKPPALAPLVTLGAAPKDGAVCAAQTAIPNEQLLVGPQGGIANVFVYLDRLPAVLQGVTTPVPSDPVIFDRKACMFIPHALLVRVGQKILVKNGDPIVSNVHTDPRRNQQSNFLVRANERGFRSSTRNQRASRSESDPISTIGKAPGICRSTIGLRR